jgi:hypothetical protein
MSEIGLSFIRSLFLKYGSLTLIIMIMHMTYDACCSVFCLKSCRRRPPRSNGLPGAEIARFSHKQLPEAAKPHEKTAMQRQIEATDGQIDVLVYELYGLTEEEIGIVQKAND